METVRFRTYDGVDLSAHLYLPELRQEQTWSPGIIVFHGFGSRKENYTEFGARAQSAGLATLLVDIRGHGDSGGELDANVFNDVAAAFQYMQSRREVNPMRISIRGSSFGSWLAIHTAAHLTDIAPVIAYCPPNEAHLQIMMEEVAMVQRGHSSPLVPKTLPRVNVNSITPLLYRLNINKAAQRIYPRHLMLVHCEGDEQVPSHISQRVYDEAYEPKTLWLLPGGDHSFAQHDPETDQQLLKWLQDSQLSSTKLSAVPIPEEPPKS